MTWLIILNYSFSSESSFSSFWPTFWIKAVNKIHSHYLVCTRHCAKGTKMDKTLVPISREGKEGRKRWVGPKSTFLCGKGEKRRTSLVKSNTEQLDPYWLWVWVRSTADKTKPKIRLGIVFILLLPDSNSSVLRKETWRFHLPKYFLRNMLIGN